MVCADRDAFVAYALCVAEAFADGGEDLALAYLQLAIYLAPTHPLALMSRNPSISDSLREQARDLLRRSGGALA